MKLHVDIIKFQNLGRVSFLILHGYSCSEELRQIPLKVRAIVSAKIIY